MKLLTLLLFSLTTISSMPESMDAKGDTTSLVYIFRQPKTAQANPPLLILLHGRGSNEYDLFSFAAALPDKYLVVAVRAPFEMSKDSYQWFDVDYSSGKPVANKAMAEKSRTKLIAFIGELKVKHKFDAKQVYLCGFSQGGVMSYSVGLTRPEKVKGIAVMSGRLLEDVKPMVKNSATLKKLKVLVTHGNKDNVLGIHYAREALDYMKTLGIQPVFKEYPEGHNISKQMLKDLIDWLK